MAWLTYSPPTHQIPDTFEGLCIHAEQIRGTRPVGDEWRLGHMKRFVQDRTKGKASGMMPSKPTYAIL